MHIRGDVLDWNDLRYALAVDTHGSLLRAARALGVHQTTVGRRLGALEQALGAPLFLRTVRGLRPSPEGVRLLGTLREMAHTLERAERRATETSGARLSPVRVAVTENGARLIVRRALHKLSKSNSLISLELVVGNTAVDLTRGEADLAVRLVRPEGADLVARRIDEVRYGLYATRAYLDATGLPSADFAGHRVLLPTRELARGPEASWMATHAAAAECAFASNSLVALALAAEQGLGLVVLPTNLAQLHAGLVRVRALEIAPRPVWLVFHRDARRDARIQRAADAVSKALTNVTRALATS